MTCIIDVCDRAAESKGMCGAHYERIRLGRKVDIDTPIREWSRQVGDCIECGARRASTKGRCKPCDSRRRYLAYVLEKSEMYPWR